MNRPNDNAKQVYRKSLRSKGHQPSPVAGHYGGCERCNLRVRFDVEGHIVRNTHFPQGVAQKFWRMWFYTDNAAAGSYMELPWCENRPEQ